MNMQLHHAGLELGKGAIITLPDSAGVNIVCHDGAVWLTLDNDLRDIVLEAGDSFTGRDHRLAMIYALQPSSIGVTAPRAG